MRKSHTAPVNLAAAASHGPTPKQQSLTHGDVKHPPAVGFLDHMSPLRPSSTANQGIVNPRHYTLPRTLPVYQN